MAAANEVCGLCGRPTKGSWLFSSTCFPCIEQNERRFSDLKATHERTIASIHANNKQSVDKIEEVVKQLKDSIDFLKLKTDLERDSNDDFSGGPSPLQGDVEIVVKDEQPVQAHRFILANKSVVFRKMFQSRMLESETGIVRIHDTTLPTMRAVIAFCYTSEIEFSEEVTPEEVLKIAHKYAIDHLRDVCAKELVTKINQDNLAEILRLSSVCEAKELQVAASQYLKDNFDSAFPSVVKEVFSCLTCA